MLKKQSVSGNFLKMGFVGTCGMAYLYAESESIISVCVRNRLWFIPGSLMS